MTCNWHTGSNIAEKGYIL